MRRHQRLTGLAAAALVATFGLAACSSDSDDSEPDENSAAEEVEETGEDDAPAAEGAPAWAKEPTDGGDLIATIEAEDVTVEVYQMGTTPAPKDGNWVDPDTNEPLISEGDDLVFFNYVATNNGDPIDLGSSLVDVEARYDDWEYMQGMGGITDSDLFEEMGVNTSGPDEIADPTVYPFGTGEHFSWGENFHHQADSPITFEVTITPVDDKGELLHDDKIEAEGSGTVA